MWISARQLSLAREQACDDSVLEHGVRAHDYSKHLLDMVRWLKMVRYSAVAGMAMARPLQLELRLKGILDPQQKRYQLSRAHFVWASFLIGLFLLPLASIRPVAKVRPGAIQLEVAQDSSPTLIKVSDVQLPIPYHKADSTSVRRRMIIPRVGNGDLQNHPSSYRVIGFKEQGDRVLAEIKNVIENKVFWLAPGEAQGAISLQQANPAEHAAIVKIAGQVQRLEMADFDIFKIQEPNVSSSITPRRRILIPIGS
jgi:hypothetical protein